MQKPDKCSECSNDLEIDLFVTPSASPVKQRIAMANTPKRISRPTPEPEPEYEEELVIPDKLDIEVSFPEYEKVKAGDVIGTAINTGVAGGRKIKKLSKAARKASLKEFTDNLYRTERVDVGGRDEDSE